MDLPVICPTKQYLQNLGAISANTYSSKRGGELFVHKMAKFGKGFGIEIGEGSSLGPYCHYPNNIKIGSYVMFGPHCYITENMTHEHSRLDIPIGCQGMTSVKRRTEIGDDVWFGRQVIMMCGKHVGSHTIIAAGAVVCKDVPDYVIAGGNPIQVIKKRE